MYLSGERPPNLGPGLGTMAQPVEQVERRRLNSELWHACAGPLVSLPPVDSRVVYFPQGYTEQVAASTQKEADAHIPNYPSLPSRLVCLLENVTLHADLETDEVYAQMTLIPVPPANEKVVLMSPDMGIRSRQPTEYFCKTLTASDTSTPGGFSIPRRAAEKVFPLDFTQTPPAQELKARDLHDQEWHFRHIYRGQTRRHLLTTGWSVFVSSKRLQAGDAVLFIRDDKGQLQLGIRRQNRQQTVMPSSMLSSDSMHVGVLAAANHAAATSSRFTIFYYPRQSPSEFVIPVAKYQKAICNLQVSIGMRFRMVFETEESSVRRYMGTITGMGDLDPIRWPNSHWRSLKVGWDESTAGERQMRVSLWEIEPLTAPFLFGPPPLAFRSKRPRGGRGDEEMDMMLKKSSFWSREDGSDALGALNFRNLGMDSWMRNQPQPMQPGLPPLQNEYYRALAAAALQEFRGADTSKQSIAHVQPFLSTSQMQFRSQSPQAKQPLPGDSGSSEGEPVEVDRYETPRISSEELQLRLFLNPSDEIRDDHGGQSKLEAELHVIDMVYADIPLDFRATRFEVIKECLIASVQDVEDQVAEFSRLQSGNHIQVFNHECVYFVDTLSGTVHDRLRRYNNTLSLVQRWAGVSDPESRIFMSVAFCIVALTELERMFKAVVDLLTSCSKEDWWNTALELSNTLPSRTIPRWSSFSLAIRSCEWSMDIVDFGFHALEQFLAGASTVTGVVFKWSDKQSRMVLHVDGKPLYHDEGGSSLLDVTRDLEGKDVTALIQKLVDLTETPRKWNWFSNADANMHIIADFLSQRLHGPRPEPNSVPYTFRIKPSTLTFVDYIGKGSYGWVAEYKWLGHKVSVKMVKSPGLSRKQFEMEAAILATVQHPRVVRMIGCAFEENRETGSLVMELMEGDLRHMIKKRCPNPARGVSPFPLVVAIDIMLQIGEGMQYLREHRILHRDLKAQNVLLNRCRTSECGAYGKFPALASLLPEEYYIVKLADFGIAKASRAQTVFGTMMAGTTSWRAPEVYKVPNVETAQNYEWPADVYSFAMTCYEILTGCIPFDGVPNSELYKRIVAGDRPPLDGVKIPPLVKDLVERCWKTDPNERPNFDEICKILWQCKVENILPAFELQIGPSQATGRVKRVKLFHS